MLRLEIIGHVGQDAETKGFNEYTIINFSVAHTEKWKDGNNQPQSRTTWVNCQIWRKDGQSIKIADYLKKGTLVRVEGKPKARAWINESTVEAKCSLDLQVKDVELLGAAKPRTESDTSQEPAGTSPYHEDDLPF